MSRPRNTDPICPKCGCEKRRKRGPGRSPTCGACFDKAYRQTRYYSREEILELAMKKRFLAAQRAAL